MKKLILALSILVMCISAQGQVLRTFTARYYNPSVKGNIIQVANNIISNVGGNSLASNPGNVNEAPPGGASRNNGVTTKNINIDAMIPFGSTWKYLANAGARPLNWHTSAFGDGAWP